MARITTIDKECEFCKQTFVTLDPRKRFCNRSCSASFTNNVKPKRTRKPREPKPERKSTVQKWLDGEIDGTTKQGLSQPVRLFLLAEAGYKCQSDYCSVPGGWSGVNPASGKTTLTVDHVDGRSDNNHRSNLVVLCPNCHSLTPTYGALNKGNGRASRYMG